MSVMDWGSRGGGDWGDWSNEGSGGGGGDSGMRDLLSMEERFRVVSFNSMVEGLNVEEARALLKTMHEHMVVKNRVTAQIMKGESVESIERIMGRVGKE